MLLTQLLKLQPPYDNRLNNAEYFTDEEIRQTETNWPGIGSFFNSADYRSPNYTQVIQINDWFKMNSFDRYEVCGNNSDLTKIQIFAKV